ncbi:MAG: hypothetical protein V4607_11965 [Pseudomonadota bacterium]
MDKVNEMLFSLQRFQIMALYTSTAAERTVSDSYAYAWAESTYPLLHESACWHQPYDSSFAIGATQMKELYGYLSDVWKSKKSVTFFQMEDHYGIKGSKRPGPVWSQASLILACRYLYLYQAFDSAFWSSLLSGSQCPIEAETISRKFDAGEIHFE